MRLPRLGAAALLLLLASAGAAEPQAVDRDIAGIVDLFHDLQFERALRASEGLKARYPGHPAGDFYRSIVFYQRFQVEDPRSTETFKTYERANALCLAAAEAARPKDAAAAELYLAAGHGFRSRALAALKRYSEAIDEAKRSYRHVKTAVALEPERDDAYLGLGMFDYFMSRAPAAAKPLMYLVLGSWGDREKGLAELERVALKGAAAKMEARGVLAAVYSSEKEKQWDKAEAYLAELMTRYPHNPQHRLRRVYVAQRRGRHDLAVSWADPGGDWVEQLDAPHRERARASARYRAAESLLLSGKPEDAAPLLEALERTVLKDSLRDWTSLRMANLFDSRGERARAERIYRSLSGREPGPEAAAYLSQAFPRGPRTVMRFNDRSGL